MVPRHPWTLLLVLLARVADAEELAGRREHRAAEPDREALHLVRDDVDVDLLGRRRRAEGPEALDVEVEALVDVLLDVALEPAPEVLEHRRPAREHDVLV